MKKLFLTLVVAIATLGVVFSCKKEKDPAPTAKSLTVTADKQTAKVNEQITFTVKDDLGNEVKDATLKNGAARLKSNVWAFDKAGSYKIVASKEGLTSGEIDITIEADPAQPGGGDGTTPGGGDGTPPGGGDGTQPPVAMGEGTYSLEPMPSDFIVDGLGFSTVNVLKAVNVLGVQVVYYGQKEKPKGGNTLQYNDYEIYLVGDNGTLAFFGIQPFVSGDSSVVAPKLAASNDYRFGQEYVLSGMIETDISGNLVAAFPLLDINNILGFGAGITTIENTPTSRGAFKITSIDFNAKTINFEYKTNVKLSTSPTLYPFTAKYTGEFVYFDESAAPSTAKGKSKSTFNKVKPMVNTNAIKAMSVDMQTKRK